MALDSAFVAAVESESHVPIQALAIAGSAATELRDDQSQDIDMLAVVQELRPRRSRSLARGRLLDVFWESRDSLTRELLTPRRGAIVGLIATIEVIYDFQDGFLLGARQMAQELLRQPAPETLFPSLWKFREESRDLAQIYLNGIGNRTLARASLITLLVELSFAEVRCWPVRINKAVEHIRKIDANLAREVESAATDDSALISLVSRLVPDLRLKPP